MKKVLMVLLVASLLLLASCSPQPAVPADEEVLDGVPEGVQGGLEIAVIRNLASDDHTTQFLDGARAEGQAFGFKVDTFISEADDVRFQELVNQAIQKGYDGLIVSHGKDSYSYDMLEPAVEAGIEVVVFDTVIEKDGQTLPEITTTFQDDFELARLSLEEVAALSESGEPVRVIKLWMAGFPPLDRRQVTYEEFEEAGKITTLETIGVTNFQDVQGDIADKVAAVLAKYPAGEIDAVWACWDEMAKGAYTALKENNRTEMPLISIDISNQDINLMLEEGSNWVSTAAVDPALIGRVNMRLLAKKLAGEATPDNYDLEANLIKQEQLSPGTSMLNLHEAVKGWGVTDAFNESWMGILRAHYAN